MSDKIRAEFEARGQYSKRLLWKRGGSAFAEDTPESDYVDPSVQRDWLLWNEAWNASRLAALEQAAKAVESVERFIDEVGNGLMLNPDGNAIFLEDAIDAIRRLATDNSHGERG